MEKVVGVRFKPVGKIYNFSCGAFVLDVGDHVIVETEQGLGLAVVSTPPSFCDEKSSKTPLKKVFRLAGEEDFLQRKKNIEAQKKAYAFCLKHIKELGLRMNLFSVESNFEGNKLTFFFTAEGRIDFRQLVKILVKEFRIRIEMRQVGIRNQAKMCGGIGRCGRELCCSSFISKFEPVSIRMAKEQGLSLNPTKISGLCGRLMCCLTFEDKTYGGLRKEFPKTGTPVTASGNKGIITSGNIISDSVTVQLDSGSKTEAKLTEINKRTE